MTGRKYDSISPAMKSTIAAVGTLFAVASSADGYEDAVIRTDDASVRAIVLPTRFVYAFTNTSGSVSVVLKEAELINRTLVVAGGGGGGYGVSGGGGGGGVLVSDQSHSLVAEGVISLTVGAGGKGAVNNDAPAANGTDSMLTIDAVAQTAIGGGKGGSYKDTEEFAKGGNGGSGGGSTFKNTYAGGSGTAGQGHDGAKWKSTKPGPGGGGGAGTAATDHETTTGSTGGEGLGNDIEGSAVVYGSGGGSGGGVANSVTYVGGKGGTNAGGGGVFIGKDNEGNVVGGDGVDGTGGGGGGCGGNGGSGIVALGFTPTTEGILTIASDMNVPSAALPSIGLCSFLTKTNVTVTATDVTVDSLKYTCKGYAIETYDSFAASWGAATTNSATSFTLSDVAGKCVRITWLWERSLDADTVYEDRILKSSIPFRKKKIADDDYAYVFADTSAKGSVVLKTDATVSSALVVAGGGGGGYSIGGGGGGGGVIYATELSLALNAADAFTLAVGAGGTGAASNAGPATNGGDSELCFNATNFVAVGGGKGGSWSSSYGEGGNGGSGGGSTYNNSQNAGTGIAGQGNAGGKAKQTGPGGGGGATAVGGQKTDDNIAGAGGAGLTCSITGAAQVYGSGGGAGGGKNTQITTELSSGAGGTNAGDGGGNSGVDGFGGGGGGGAVNGAGGNGGSGVIVLRITGFPQTGFAIIIR